MSDLYSKLIAPELPQEWVAWLQPYSVWLNVATPWVVAFILLGAILYTYYEVEQRVTRDPSIPEKLQDFYVRAEPLANYTLGDESEYPAYRTSVLNWHKETCDWIARNMSNAALSRFKNRPGQMRVRSRDAVNNEHDDMVHTVSQLMENLTTLIENEAWDKPTGTKVRRWRLANIFRSKKPAS